jgi:hypothetical protein
MLTADAYGALIQCIKDTTDDTARALLVYYLSPPQSHERAKRTNSLFSTLASSPILSKVALSASAGV